MKEKKQAKSNKNEPMWDVLCLMISYEVFVSVFLTIKWLLH